MASGGHIVARGLVLLCTLGALAACGGSSDTSGNLDASHIAPSPTDGAVGDVSSTADGAGEPSSTDSVGAGPGADGGATLEPECLVDEDCDVVGMACSCLGECVDVSGKTTCTEPKNCGSSGWCDPCTGHCEPMVGLCQPCSTAGLCAPGGACRAPEDGACAVAGVGRAARQQLVQDGAQRIDV